MAKKGGVGGPMHLMRVSSRCKHDWTRFERSGIFDSTMRRNCKRCGRIQTRTPAQMRAKRGRGDV